MKGLAICDIGVENVLSEELFELAKVKTSVGRGFVVFESEKFEDFLVITYLSQAASRILILVDNFEFVDFDKEVEGKIASLDFSGFFSEDSSFSVRAILEDSGLETPKVERMVGGSIHDLTNNPVDLDSPDIPIIAYVNKNTCFVGVDLSGFDLSVREYKIFNHPLALKGTTAYAFVRLSGFEKGNVFLDSFSKCGSISIEAFLFCSKTSPRFFQKQKFSFLDLKPFEDFDFDKFFEKQDGNVVKCAGIHNYSGFSPNINCAKKNAKIAGVDKSINFSKVGIEDLDLKFKKEQIDIFVSYLSKSEADSGVLDDFLRQVELLLNPGGSVVLAFRGDFKLENHLKDSLLQISEKNRVFRGGLEFFVFVLRKQ